MISMKQLGMPSCEEVSLLISQTHDRPLSWRERWKIRLHVMMCRYCARFLAQLGLLHGAVEKDKRG
jgi:putative zinc finger protein